MKLNTDKCKTVKFDVTVSGVDVRDLVGSMKLIMDGYEIGLPIHIMDNTVSVDIPPLSDIIKGDLKEGQVIDAKLELIAGDTYIMPWQDTIRIERPITVEATITEIIDDIKEDVKPKIDVKAILDEKVKEKKLEKPKIVKSIIKSRFAKALG
jgi:hypothetical protein